MYGDQTAIAGHPAQRFEAVARPGTRGRIL
jgi:hypothetical protein